MKLFLIFFLSVFIGNHVIAAIPDTAGRPLPDKRALIMKHYQNASALNAAGYVMLGGGVLFGALALAEFAIEAAAFAATFPFAIILGEEQKTNTTKFAEHFIVSACLLVASIPFFIIGGSQKYKARRLSVFSETATSPSFYRPNFQFNKLTDFNVGIKIRIGK
jgi:hypothetical protein